MRSLAALVLLAGGCTFLVGESQEDAAIFSGFDLGTPCDPGLLTSDVRNCGACGRDCTRLPGVEPARVRCSFGACEIEGACQPARGDCTIADGCETDLSSRTSCGACGRTCGGNTPFCVADTTGAFFCSAACGGTTPDLCGMSCVDTASDPRHCGMCNNACPAPLHGKALCGFFGCDFECDAGFTRSGTSCVAPVVDMAIKRDMSMPKDFASPFDLRGLDFSSNTPPDFEGLPACDCSGLVDPLGGTNPCALTNQCVGYDCCLESQILMQPGTCLDLTPCAPSTTGP